MISNDADWISSQIAELEQKDVEFNTHWLMIKVAERIAQRMTQIGMNRSSLAQALNVSKPFVTKLLNGSSNLTLRTLVAVSLALKSTVQFDLMSAETEPEWAPPTRTRHGNVIAFKTHAWRALDVYELERIPEDNQDDEVAAGA